MLLPIYEVYIRALFLVSTVNSILQLTDTVGFIARPPHPGNVWSFIIIGFTWGSYHGLFEGVVFLLLSRTLGSRTLRKVKWLSLGWFVITFGLVGGAAYLGTHNVDKWKDILGFTLFELWNFSLFVFYVVVAFFPQRLICCHRRPSAKTFAIFFAVVRGGNLLADIITFEYYTAPLSPSPSPQPHPNRTTAAPGAESWSDLGYCLNFVFTGVVFSGAVPVVVYFALLQDSKHWRGNIKLTTSPSSKYKNSHRHRNSNSLVESDIRAPLMGLDLNSGEVSVVHRNMEHVPENLLIDFYELSLNPMNCLGIGGTARVYRGVLRGKPVAIKMLVCVELTEELVASFFQEAVTLSVLSKCHPNIVDVNGICVAPPALCIVLELCAGSLFDAWQDEKDPESRAVSLDKVKTQYQHSTLGRSRANSRASRSHSSSFSTPFSSSSFLSFLSPSSHTKTSMGTDAKNGQGGRSLSTGYRSQTSNSFFAQSSATITTQDAMTYYQNIQTRPRSLSSANASSKTHPLVVTSAAAAAAAASISADTVTNLIFLFLDEAIQCVRPVAFLHQLCPPRCHRDIKSLNYLVAKSISPHRKLQQLGPEIKLADMETVSIVQEDSVVEDVAVGDTSSNTSHDSSRTSSTGGSVDNIPPVAFTPQWCAPEVMEPIMLGAPSPSFEPPSDVYSLTMVLYECLTHEVPFHEWDKFAEIDQLVVHQQKRPTLPDWIPAQLIALFQIGWNQDPTQRCTAQHILHRLIEMYDLCGERGQRMMEYQQAVSHATVLNMPIYNLKQDRRYRMGTTYLNCALGSELLHFVICHSTLFTRHSNSTSTEINSEESIAADTRETKKTEQKQRKKSWATSNNSFNKAKAKELLQDLLDRRLLRSVTGGDSNQFEEMGVTYYYIFPKKWNETRNSEEKSETTRARMKFG